MTVADSNQKKIFKLFYLQSCPVSEEQERNKNPVKERRLRKQIFTRIENKYLQAEQEEETNIYKKRKQIFTR